MSSQKKRQREIRIVIFPPDAQLMREIALYDPYTGRIIRDGQREGPSRDAIDKAVRTLKNKFERDRYYVTFRDMSD